MVVLVGERERAWLCKAHIYAGLNLFFEKIEKILAPLRFLSKIAPRQLAKALALKCELANDPVHIEWVVSSGVEQWTFNPLVEGSNPSQPTKLQRPFDMGR